MPETGPLRPVVTPLPIPVRAAGAAPRRHDADGLVRQLTARLGA
jgi:hypothetical protein